MENVNVNILDTLSAEQAWHYKIFPKEAESNELVLYTDQLGDQNYLIDELELVTGKSITLQSIDEKTLNNLLTEYYKRKIELKEIERRDIENGQFLSQLIHQAQEYNSSDIHLEAFEEQGKVRIRVDGALVDIYKIEKKYYPALINKIKIQSQLDIAEKRLPQDGRMQYRRGEMAFDIRVSILPTIYGEKVVMRLLKMSASSINIEDLGMKENEQKTYLHNIKQSNGIILISGPTGSGKTTTLYATLKLLNSPEKNILTIEDPVEYTLDGINQIQVQENIGLSFPRVLRTSLRQDPDVIMIGEIRDEETAQIAVRASLTGHLVLSTIHTNEALGVISRMIDMGVSPLLIAETLRMAVAQRLLRKVCETCMVEKELDPSSLPPGFNSNITISKQFVGMGCNDCFQTGYKGRIGIFEVVPIDERIRVALLNESFNAKEIYESSKIKTLKQQALDLLVSGLSSLEEVYPYLSKAY